MPLMQCIDGREKGGSISKSPRSSWPLRHPGLFTIPSRGAEFLPMLLLIGSDFQGAAIPQSRHDVTWPWHFSRVSFRVGLETALYLLLVHTEERSSACGYYPHQFVLVCYKMASLAKSNRKCSRLAAGLSGFAHALSSAVKVSVLRRAVRILPDHKSRRRREGGGREVATLARYV